MSDKKELNDAAVTALVLVEMDVDKKMSALLGVDGDLDSSDMGALNALRWVKSQLHKLSAVYKVSNELDNPN